MGDITYNKPFLVICEGPSDEKFFRLLAEKNSLKDKYDVYCARNDLGHRAGRSGFKAHLFGLRTQIALKGIIRGIVLVIDSEESANDSLVFIKNQLSRAKYTTHLNS